jgi:hypothetical protein
LVVVDDFFKDWGYYINRSENVKIVPDFFGLFYKHWSYNPMANLWLKYFECNFFVFKTAPLA